MALSLGEVVSYVWIEALETTPCDFWEDSPLLELLEGRRRTYRQQLDRRRKNAFGKFLTRIAVVRYNLRRMEKPPKSPRLPE